MRKLSLLILIALLFDIFALHPVSISMQYDGHATLVALDVCHAPGNGLADHNDVPCETGKPLTATPHQFLQHSDSFASLSIQRLFATRYERPPIR